MENAQFSFLTSLFGGKPISDASAGAKALFASDADGADKNSQGFFSFIESLLKTAPDGDDETTDPTANLTINPTVNLLGAQPAFAAQIFSPETVKENTEGETTLAATVATAAAPEVVLEKGLRAVASNTALTAAWPAAQPASSGGATTTAGGTLAAAKDVGGTLATAKDAGGTLATAKDAGGTLAAAKDVGGTLATAKDVGGTLATAKDAAATQQDIDASVLDASAGDAPTLEAQAPLTKASQQVQERTVPVTGLVKLPEGEGLVAEDAEPGHDLSAETLRGGDENAQNNLFPPRQNVKAPGLAANAHANAAAAIAEHAAPEALSHSAVTRDDGGLEFDRVASSRLETVSAAANSNIHVNPVRDQIVAAVTARHGEHKLEVRLDPPELGRVTIGFERDGGDIVRAVISANTPDTLDLMRRHADVFQRALEDQGFTGLDLHFADHGPQEGPAGQAGESTQNFRLSEEDAPAAMMTGPAPRAVLGRLDRRL